MGKISILSVICSILQIVGLIIVLFLPDFTPVLLGIAGFASIVKYFLPDAESKIDKTIRTIAAVVGLIMIFVALTK